MVCGVVTVGRQVGDDVFFFRWVKGRQTKGGKVDQGGWLWGLYITRQDDTERPFQAQ